MKRGGVHLHAVCQPDSSTQGRCGKRQTCIPASLYPVCTGQSWKRRGFMFWNPEVITTTGKSLRITQIQFNIIYIMRTNINQGRIQSLAVMIVLLINNDQNPISYLIPYSRLNRSCNLNTLVSTTSYPLYGINAAISAIADKKEDLKVVWSRQY